MTVFTEDERAALFGLTEASEVEVTDLSKPQQALVKRLERSFKGKASQAFDGVHGAVVMIDLEGPAVLGRRFPGKSLKPLADKMVRWAEFNKDYITVAM